MRKGQLLKTVAIILICVLIDIALHAMTSGYSTMPEDPNYSKFADMFGTEITATLWALIAFSGAAYVFHRLRSSIPGVGLSKGLRYGAAISLLWLFAMLEGVALFGNPMLNEFVVGLSDAIPAFLLGVLLGLSINKNEDPASKPFNLGRKTLIICVFAGVFLIGRYFGYLSGSIESGYQTSPLYTFFWTLIMGAFIGVACILLEDPGKQLQLKNRAARFGLLFFGVNWTTFLIFMPFLFSGFLTDVLTRIVLDISLVTIAYIIAFNSRIKFLKEEYPEKA